MYEILKPVKISKRFRPIVAWSAKADVYWQMWRNTEIWDVGFLQRFWHFCQPKCMPPASQHGWCVEIKELLTLSCNNFLLREALTSFRIVFNRLVAFWIISSPLSFLSRKSFSKSWTQTPQNWGELFAGWLKNQCWFVPRPPPQINFGFSYYKKQSWTWERVLFHMPFTVARSDMPNLPPPDRDLRSSCPLGQRGCTSGHSWRFGSAEIKSEREYIRQERTLTLLPHHQWDTTTKVCSFPW